MVKSPIQSQQVERNALAGILKHPQIYPDVSGFISDKDFYHDVHKTIYAIIGETIVKKERPDKILLAKKVENLGIKFKDDINIYDYFDTLSYSQITPEAAINSFKEIVELRIKRELCEMASKVIEHVYDNQDRSANLLIPDCDRIYHNLIKGYTFDDAPINLFADMERVIEELGNNPVDSMGYLTPWRNFNDFYGGFRPANLYAFVARPGQGKTNFLNETAFGTALLTNFKLKVLVLDTEMETQDMQKRFAASLSGVPFGLIDNGKWRHNPEHLKKVRDIWPIIKNYRYDYYRVGNKTIDQVCSLIRRWYFKNVGRGEQAMVVYDYIKLTGEKLEKNWAEYQAIGDKIDKLKKMAEEINAPILTATQLNRSGEGDGRKGFEISDDSSAIAQSDRLQWFASFVGIFRRKTLDEILKDGQKYGTHKLIPLKSRFQGEKAPGHFDVVKRFDEDGGKPRYVRNYINFNVENFKVSERGSLHDVVKEENLQLSLTDPKKEGEIDF